MEKKTIIFQISRKLLSNDSIFNEYLPLFLSLSVSFFCFIFGTCELRNADGLSDNFRIPFRSVPLLLIPAVSSPSSLTLFPLPCSTFWFVLLAVSREFVLLSWRHSHPLSHLTFYSSSPASPPHLPHLFLFFVCVFISNTFSRPTPPSLLFIVVHLYFDTR